MVVTLDRRLSKKLMQSIKADKTNRNRVQDCKLLKNWQQVEIENTVSKDFYPSLLIVDSIFDCRLSSVRILNYSNEPMWSWLVMG